MFVETVVRPVVVMHTRMGTTRSDVGRIVCFRSGRSEQEQYILPRPRDTVILLFSSLCLVEVPGALYPIGVGVNCFALHQWIPAHSSTGNKRACSHVLWAQLSSRKGCNKWSKGLGVSSRVSPVRPTLLAMVGAQTSLGGSAAAPVMPDGVTHS